MKVRHDGTLSARVLRAVAAAPEVKTSDLIHLYWKPERWPDPAVTRQRALARIGNELRDLTAHGLVERTGKTPDTGWQKAPTHLWRITEAGRDLIAWWDDPSRSEQLAVAAANRVAAAEVRVARRGERESSLTTTALAWSGRKIPKAVREQEAVRLRALGASLREIAAALNVTAECIRLDTKDVEVGQRRHKPRPYVVNSGRGRGRRPKFMKQLDDGPMAGLLEVTFTEF